MFRLKHKGISFEETKENRTVPLHRRAFLEKRKTVRGVGENAPKAKKSYPRIACQHIFDEPFGLSDLTGASPSAPLRTEILSQICADRCSQF